MTRSNRLQLSSKEGQKGVEGKYGDQRGGAAADNTIQGHSWSIR